MTFSRKGSAKTVAKQPTSSHVKCPVAQLSAKRPANDFIDLEEIKEIKKPKLNSDDLWLKIYNLTIRDKEIIKKNLWLNDKQNILKNNINMVTVTNTLDRVTFLL